MPYYVCALPNKKGDGIPQEFISDDPAKIEEWAQQHDKPGWGVFDCHNPLKPGAPRRTKETIGAIECIYADVDPKNVVETMEEVDARLRDFLIPLEIRDSGRGRHIGSKLKEPIDPNDAEMVARVDTARKRLTEILCGDPQVCHQAALRRRPGTHNTKDGGWAECKVLTNEAIEHDLTEWEEALALYDRALFTPKPPAVGENVEYIDFGAGGTSKPPIDVEERLAAMRYQGPGNTGINITWWECMGSLLRHDVSVNETINRLHDAAAMNCQDDPNKANWMRDLAGMMERWLKHEPQFLQALDSGHYKKWQAAVAAGKTPRLIWRQDLGLQVRGLEQAEPRSLGAAAADGSGATITPLAPPNAAPARRIVLLPYAAPDPAKIPRRQWLFDYHYMRKIVSATIGPGGIGKSSLDLIEAVGMSVGMNLLTGEKLPASLRVWYHNGEDPMDELNRRIAAICMHFVVDEQQVRKNLRVTCGLDMPIKVAKGGTEIRLDRKLVEEISEVIIEEKMDVSIFDPLVTMHNANEILTATMDPVIREVFATIANETNSAVELSHHTRKKAAGQDEYTTADARGSSSIVDAVRGMRVANQMSRREAEEFGIEDGDRFDYFKVTKGKANMTRSGPGKWYRFVSIELPNGDPEAGIPGDSVGVLEGWDSPNTKVALTDDDRAYFRTLVAGDPNYRDDIRSKQWIGVAIARRLSLDLNTKIGKTRAKNVLKSLLEARDLAIEERSDGHRELKRFITVGDRRGMNRRSSEEE
jgi:AAA domain